MTLSLRPYQRAAIEALYDYFSASSGNPLVVMPTGTGKSLCIAGFTREAIAAYGDTRVLILTHVKELIQQNFMALLRAWPEAPAGIYSAGLSRRDIHAQILFAGIQSIHRHARQVQRCDLVLIDEAHLLGRGDSGMYRSFLAQLNEINAGLLKIVGFTATPYRLDSGMLHEGKDRLFTDIAFQVPVLEMIQQGYLCPVVPKQTSTQLDVGGVGTRGGEFIAKDLEAAVDRDEVTRAAVAEIVQHGEGRGSWLVFCSGVAHARHVRDAIREHGISAETVTGDTPGPERDGILAAFKAGRLRCVTNANVLTTGFDAPGWTSSRCSAPRRAWASTSRWSAAARASPRARMTASCWTSLATRRGTVRSTRWMAGRRNLPAMARRRSRCAPSARPSTTPARGTASSVITSSRRPW